MNPCGDDLVVDLCSHLNQHDYKLLSFLEILTNAWIEVDGDGSSGITAVMRPLAVGAAVILLTDVSLTGITESGA